jgi:hypothetical protein
MISLALPATLQGKQTGMLYVPHTVDEKYLKNLNRLLAIKIKRYIEEEMSDRETEHAHQKILISLLVTTSELSTRQGFIAELQRMLQKIGLRLITEKTVIYNIIQIFFCCLINRS